MSPAEEFGRAAATSKNVAHGCCGSGRGTILRIGLVEDTDRRPLKAHIDRCPTCGEDHIVSLMWRRLEERDAGIEPDLWVDAAGAQVDRDR